MPRILFVIITIIYAIEISAAASGTGSLNTAQISREEYDKVGRVPTLNNMGWMHPHIDEITAQLLVSCLENKSLKVLEIGAAYGYASEEAVKNGAEVWINDLDIKHLEVFKKNMSDKQIHGKFHLVSGDFPDAVSLPENFFDSILAIRVLHFFAPSQLEKAAAAMYKHLKKGGKAYIVAETPYLKNWAAYIPVYEQKKAAGNLYPGYLTNPKQYNPINAKYTPDSLHFLDPDVLTRVFTQAGFKVITAKFLDRTDYPTNMRLNGKESVGVIAIKE